jgi:hypothetical protein
MYDPNDFDDFDTQITPEELMDDNPIDEDYEGSFYPVEGFNDDGMGHEYDEGSDRDNWEAEQVFQDHEC